jgi:iron complex transport system substrate-binding protein
MRRLALAASIGTLLGLCGAGSAAAVDIELRDDRGAVQRLAAPPARIVSLMPSLTEAVWVLGGGARLVGVDRHSNWPPALAGLPRLGGLDDAPIEAIVALAPDVVLASTSARALDRLDALGLKVLRLNSDTHADVRRTLALLAQLLGTPTAGERVWAGIERELAVSRARVPPSLRGQAVYFEVGAGPWAAGRSSFIGETLTALGLANIVPAEMGPFPKLNPEFVVQARPAVILGVQREVATMAARPGWAALPALREGRLCGFAPAAYDTLVRPGPRLGEAAALVADCLQRLELAR